MYSCCENEIVSFRYDLLIKPIHYLDAIDGVKNECHGDGVVEES